jgi:hypothetical protein
MEGSLLMLHEIIPFLPVTESASGGEPHSAWAYCPQRVLHGPDAESEPCLDHLPEKPRFRGHPCTGVKCELEETNKKEDAALNVGHSLFQESFFFCTVKNVGDVPGTGCIYAETVVDRDSGIAFAKVYSAKNAMNALDILESRVVPFFERQGIAIKEIHTRRTSKYCGLLSVHPFESFLATSHIQHRPMDQPSHPNNFLCEQFYRVLLQEFFLPALRRKFQVSLGDLQKDLDTFVEARNAAEMKHEYRMKSGLPPTANFPVDL